MGNNIFKDYLLFWKNYANFTGRTPRRGYWMYVLWNTLIYALLYLLYYLFGFSSQSMSFYGVNILNYQTLNPFGVILSLVMMAYGLATLIPGIALTVRRLHDIGRRWHLILVNYIPVALLIVTLAIVFAQAGLATSYNDVMRIVSSLIVLMVICGIVSIIIEIVWIVLMALPTSPNAIGVSTHDGTVAGGRARASQGAAAAYGAPAYGAPAAYGTPAAHGAAAPLGGPAAYGAPAYGAPAVGGQAGGMAVGQAGAPAGGMAAGAAGGMADAAIIGLTGVWRGYSFPIRHGEEIVLGRDAAVAQIVFDQGCEKVSRRHVSVTFDANAQLFRVIDFSTNGTFREDGSRLLSNSINMLPRGTVLNLGSAQNSVRLS
jgi:uncharacterized membrane protein YhaH (DUF805 family)